MNTLTGKRVLEVYRDGDQNMYLVTDVGLTRLEAVGDCCAYSHFVHVSNLDAMLWGRILKVEKVEMEDEDDCGDEVVNCWLWSLRSSSGTTQIELRCNHNGYYGGWVEVSEVEEVPESAKRLTEDF